MSKPPSLICQCGRLMPKAARVHRGVPYCRTCYDRDFVIRPCRECGAVARLHYHEPSGLCRACNIADRRCLRCQGEVPRAALRLVEGVVCPNCRYYFPPYRRREHRPDHLTCAGCRRSRQPAIFTLNRKPLCKRCIDPGQVEVARIEQEGYWIRTALHRCRVASQALSSDWHRELAMDFVTFLVEEIGPTKSALEVEAQIKHVALLQERLPDAQPPTSEQLLSHFTSAEVRKADLFFRCLANQGVRVPSRQDMEDETERRRARASMQLVESNSLLPSIRAYHQKLIDRGASTKSIRLSIHAAVAFSLFCHGAPSSEALSFYLEQAPGQRNAVYGFIVFLRNEGHHLDPPQKRAASRRQVYSSDGRTAIEIAQTTTSFAEFKSLIAGVLNAGTGIALETCVRLPRLAVTHAPDGRVRLRINNLEEYAPAALAQLLSRYLTERDKTVGPKSPHLFPGRPVTEPITVSAVRYHLEKWNLSIEKMGMSARAKNKRIVRAKRQTKTLAARR